MLPAQRRQPMSFLLGDHSAAAQLQHGGHLVQAVGREDHVHAVGAVLPDLGVGQGLKPGGNRPRRVGRGGQPRLVPRKDVAPGARDDHQPGIFDPGVRTVLGVVGFLVGDAVLTAELPAEIDADGGWHGQTPSRCRSRIACSAARRRLVGERTAI
jgi:hypothetical protein